jgi:hypothetical protein
MDRIWIEDEVDNVILEHAGLYNDASTRSLVKKAVRNALMVMAEIESVSVVCDETNNCEDAVAQNKMIVDVSCVLASGKMISLTFRGDI